MHELSSFDLDSFTPYRLTVAAKKLSDGLAKRYQSQYGISVPEWRVLVNLSQADGVSVRDIEAKVALEKSKVSRAATRLEAQGYIVKQINENDRRLVQLALTDKGRALMDELLPMARDFQLQIEAQLGSVFAAFEQGLDNLLRDEKE